MACLDRLCPEESFFSLKNAKHASTAEVCKVAPEQTTRLLQQLPLHKQDQMFDHDAQCQKENRAY